MLRNCETLFNEPATQLWIDLKNVLLFRQNSRCDACVAPTVYLIQRSHLLCQRLVERHSKFAFRDSAKPLLNDIPRAIDQVELRLVSKS